MTPLPTAGSPLPGPAGIPAGRGRRAVLLTGLALLPLMLVLALVVVLGMASASATGGCGGG